jgi:hypothetical protein
MTEGQLSIEVRLARLRGSQVPDTYTARKIAALAGNPGCRRRAVMDAAAIDKKTIAGYVGFPAPFGESPFAKARGTTFEASIKSDPGGLFLRLLREALGLDLTEVGFTDLDDVGGNQDLGLRHRHTRNRLTAAATRRGTLFYHPLLSFRVGGRRAYLEPDLVAFRLDGSFHVIEIKSFPVIDGQGDPASVSAAAIQSAVYVLALRDLLGDDARVHDQTVLITPRDFSNVPMTSLIDVRKQIATLTRQVSRMEGIGDIIRDQPDDLTFDLGADDSGVPQRDPDDVIAALKAFEARYAPECLATCEVCYFCRDEAGGSTTVLGKSVREELGNVESVRRALGFARGRVPGTVPAEFAEAATILRRAASLRDEVLGGRAGDTAS